MWEMEMNKRKNIIQHKQRKERRTMCAYLQQYAITGFQSAHLVFLRWMLMCSSNQYINHTAKTKRLWKEDSPFRYKIAIFHYIFGIKKVILSLHFNAKHFIGLQWRNISSDFLDVQPLHQNVKRFALRSHHKISLWKWKPDDSLKESG